MSLIRFLAAGKSLIEAKSENSPYKMKPRNWLPKFLSDEKPKPPLTTATAPACSLTMDENAGTPNSKAFYPQAAPPELRKSILRSLFTPRLAMTRNRPFIQGELSLETVRVVRNDLGDADVEVLRVAATVRKAPAIERNPGSGDKRGPAASWGQVTARLLKVSSPRA